MEVFIMKESSFARTLRDKLSPLGQWSRIENIAGAGIPDVNWYPGLDVWIELKVAKGNKVLFQASQIAWANHRHKKHGVVWIAVRTEKEIILSDSVALYNKIRYENHKPVIHVSVIKDYGVTFKKPFNWKEFISILLRDIQFATVMGTER